MAILRMITVPKLFFRVGFTFKKNFWAAQIVLTFFGERGLLYTSTSVWELSPRTLVEIDQKHNKTQEFHFIYVCAQHYGKGRS